jgi:hypothetical protein
VPFAVAVDANEADNWIEYVTKTGIVFRNGPKGKDCYPSRELAALPATLIGDPVVETFRVFFDAEATK